MPATLTSLTPGTNEDVRFLLTVGDAEEWANVDTNVGTIEGDNDLPPEIGEVNWEGDGPTRFVLRRASGESASMSAYVANNQGKSLYILLDDEQTIVMRAKNATTSRGAHWIRWNIAEQSVRDQLDTVQVGHVLLFVVADTGSVEINLSPTFDSDPVDQTGTVGVPFSYTLPAASGGNGTLTYSMAGLPSWASFDAGTRVLSGTPDAAATTTVAYTVTDEDGSTDQAMFDLIIAADDLMPSLDAVADQSGQVSTPFSVTLPEATGGDPPLTYSVTGAPSWASFDASTRVLSGTPDAAGTTTVTYTATDADGDMAEVMFDIAVSAAPPPPPPPSPSPPPQPAPTEPRVSSPFWLTSKVGQFPAVTASATDVLGQIGTFVAQVPNTKEYRDALTWGLRVDLLAEGGRRLAQGYVTGVDLAESAGVTSLSVICQTLAIELKRRQVPFGKVFIDEPVGEVVAWLVGQVSGWRLSLARPDVLEGSITVNLGVQSVFDALVNVAQLNGFLFSFRERRVVVHDREQTTPSVVLRQSMPGAPVAGGTASVQGLVCREHEHNVANSIRPWSGELENHVSLRRATLDTPHIVEKRLVDGRFEYWMTDSRCAARYGLIEISESPPQLIAPLGEVESAGFNAANTLYRWAAAVLKVRCEPQVVYDAVCLHLPDDMLPGQTARLLWKGAGVDDVDVTTVVSQVTRNLSAQGEQQLVTLTSNGELEWTAAREVARQIRGTGGSVLQLQVGSQTFGSDFEFGTGDEPTWTGSFTWELDAVVLDVLRATLTVSRVSSDDPNNMTVLVDGNDTGHVFLEGDDLTGEFDVTDILPVVHGLHRVDVYSAGGSGEVSVRLALATCTGIA